jgi:hypothetical protein
MHACMHACSRLVKYRYDGEHAESSEAWLPRCNSWLCIWNQLGSVPGSLSPRPEASGRGCDALHLGRCLSTVARSARSQPNSTGASTPTPRSARGAARPSTSGAGWARATASPPTTRRRMTLPAAPCPRGARDSVTPRGRPRRRRRPFRGCPAAAPRRVPRPGRRRGSAGRPRARCRDQAIGTPSPNEAVPGIVKLFEVLANTRLSQRSVPVPSHIPVEIDLIFASWIVSTAHSTSISRST